MISFMKISRDVEKTERFKSKEQRRIDVANDGIERVTLSFYKYVRIADAQAMRDLLHEEWRGLGCLGRIYVAPEGINAQMNVPRYNWEEFDVFMKSIPEFTDVPYKIAVEQDNSSFFRLSVRVKKKIVADGLDDELFNPSDTGRYLTAEEMNEFIADPDAVVIDMRNAYEAEVGHFQGAETMDVDTFREQLDQVTDQFADNKDKKIALYCTGGIRCEKASAWMKHNGFSDVHHVKGGIIDYAHQVKEQGIENKFRGKNFVFDERLGERISDEIIATCHLCEQTPADTHYHCQFLPCHVLFIGCEKCIEKKKGHCSYRCLLMNRMPEKMKRNYGRHKAQQKNKVVFKKHRLRGKVVK